MQVNKMLKPDKWQATFDNEGKVAGFQKALKLITLGVCLSLFFPKHCVQQDGIFVVPCCTLKTFFFSFLCSDK